MHKNGSKVYSKFSSLFQFRFFKKLFSSYLSVEEIVRSHKHIKLHNRCTTFLSIYNKKKNQHIIIISEWLCDTEEKIAFFNCNYIYKIE